MPKSLVKVYKLKFAHVKRLIKVIIIKNTNVIAALRNSDKME
jgi:hypothetical protein